jgi:hypothetical protein
MWLLKLGGIDIGSIVAKNGGNVAEEALKNG